MNAIRKYELAKDISGWTEAIFVIVLLIVTSPLWIVLLLITAPFGAYDMYMHKLEEAAHREKHGLNK